MKNSKNGDLNGRAGFDISKMKAAAENGRLDDFVSKNLSPEAAKKLSSVLSSKEATEKLLSTPQARELMKKLNGEK